MEITMYYIKSLWKCETGATAIEYGLIAALIAIAAIAGFTAVGRSVNGTFGAVATQVNQSRPR